MDINEYALSRAIDALNDSFKWSDSMEGHIYWGEVYGRLVKILNDHKVGDNHQYKPQGSKMGPIDPKSWRF